MAAATNPVVVGFTGTRNGMTAEQRSMVREILISVEAQMVVHGDCVGADADAHAIAMDLGLDVEIRPCDFPNLRAFCKNALVVHPVTSPFRRNRQIVMQCAVLIGTPATAQEQQGGGTWYTIRYGRRVGRRMFVVAPDGSYHHTPARIDGGSR